MFFFLLPEFRARLHNASKENSGGWNGGHYQVVHSTHAHILASIDTIYCIAQSGHRLMD